MKANNPIFADLSTYSPANTIPFYENIFGWEYQCEYDYYTAYLEGNPVVGLYETPDKFKQMRMPHFWMTYIQVNNADLTVKQARNLGGIIEMQETIPGYGKVALIRDPQGAGFTIYEGNALKSTRTESKPNTLIWNELHVSDINQVIPFYKGIFNWEMENFSNETVGVYNHQGEHITDILEIPNSLKGKYEYWVSYFGVADLHSTKKKVLKNGGTEIIDEGNRILMTDSFSQAFFYITQA